MPSGISAIPLVMDPRDISCSIVSLSFINLRIVIDGPSMDTGGITAFTREPSGRRASTVGLSESILLPRGG